MKIQTKDVVKIIIDCMDSVSYYKTNGYREYMTLKSRGMVKMVIYDRTFIKHITNYMERLDWDFTYKSNCNLWVKNEEMVMTGE